MGSALRRTALALTQEPISGRDGALKLMDMFKEILGSRPVKKLYHDLERMRGDVGRLRRETYQCSRSETDRGPLPCD